jgi:hypothetical protein
VHATGKQASHVQLENMYVSHFDVRIPNAATYQKIRQEKGKRGNKEKAESPSL